MAAIRHLQFVFCHFHIQFLVLKPLIYRNIFEMHCFDDLRHDDYSWNSVCNGDIVGSSPTMDVLLSTSLNVHYFRSIRMLAFTTQLNSTKPCSIQCWINTIAILFARISEKVMRLDILALPRTILQRLFLLNVTLNAYWYFCSTSKRYAIHYFVIEYQQSRNQKML